MLNLLKRNEECGLECLCELLKAIGKQLEGTLNISKFFIKLQEILNEQGQEISSYTRFVMFFEYFCSELLIDKLVSVALHKVLY